MVDAGVPGTMEELVERYDRLITWVIHKTNRGALDDDTVQELRQKVYLRIMQVSYLDRCRTYYATHTGKFSSSLSQLVRNVVYGRYDKARTDPMARATSIEADPYEGHLDLFDVEQSRIHRRLKVDSHERAIEARDALAALGRRLDSPRASIRTPQLLDAAVAHGLHSGTLAKVLGANPSTVRFHIYKVRAEARRLEGSCRTTTTKSASPSASARKRRSGALSEPQTVPA